jgi:hypothetical protein
MKYFFHSDLAVVENKLNQINQHFSLPSSKTQSYSSIIETEEAQHGFLVKLYGKYNASSFFSDGELIDYTPPPEPDPEEQTEETVE